LKQFILHASEKVAILALHTSHPQFASRQTSCNVLREKYAIAAVIRALSPSAVLHNPREKS
jgi:hypothetical protein